jgi:hypothetical protein
MPPAAKFCAECGGPLASTSTPPARGRLSARGDAVLKWFVAGTVVLALHAIAIILAVRGAGGRGGEVAGAAPAGLAGSAGAATTGGRATTDLSAMTPREAADRLYDRIARAGEGGDTAQVAFFGPMALQAYANVTPLDADARLHIGLVHLALGEPAGARAQADTIARESRTHLFGPLLLARAAEARGDAAGARAAYRAYLDRYEAERAKRLTEYEQHGTMLEQARAAAERAAGGR